MAASKEMSAFVLGYTGEVGKVLAKTLIEKQIFNKIILIGRRKVEDDLYKDVEQRVVNFDELDKFAEAFDGADIGFCVMGTTIKSAGSKENFRRVDYDYVKHAAELAKTKGVKHFLYVSSQSANAKSSQLYLKTKGEIEEAMKTIDFQHLSVLRPGLLLCDRKESRPSEAFFRKILKPVFYVSPTLMSCPVKTVVAALISLATGAEKDKVGLYENAKVHELGNSWLKENPIG